MPTISNQWWTMDNKFLFLLWQFAIYMTRMGYHIHILIQPQRPFTAPPFTTETIANFLINITIFKLQQFFNSKKCQKQWKPVKSSSCKVTEECKNSDKLWNHHCDMKVRFFRRDFSIIMSAEAVRNILSFSRKRVIYITMVHKSGFRNLLQFVIWR